MQQQFSNQISLSYLRKCQRVYNALIGKTIKFKKQRWLITIITGIITLYRIIINDYLAILYFQSIFMLYLLLQYFTPLGLPDPDQDDFQQLIQLPQYRSFQGDRPVLRSINEFPLWKSLTYLFLISYFCSLFDLFLIPVYWPFLIVYLSFLICFAFQRHYKHMRRYGYRLTDFYSKDKSNSVI